MFPYKPMHPCTGCARSTERGPSPTWDEGGEEAARFQKGLPGGGGVDTTELSCDILSLYTLTPVPNT